MREVSVGFKRLFLLSFVCFMFSACATVPAGISPVSNFEVERYLGKWYEIARLDHRFERNLQQVTAEYSLRSDGQIRVINRGFNTKTQRWSSIEGRAQFVAEPSIAQLKVSFFGPFYSSYNIVELDPNYQYALVVGNNRNYLWILSRTPILDEAVKNRLVTKVKALGFAMEQLIWVEQG